MIQAIHLRNMLALTENGSTVPIICLFDMDGEETNDLLEAVAFTAGTEETGWVSDLISDYSNPQTVN